VSDSQTAWLKPWAIHILPLSGLFMIHEVIKGIMCFDLDFNINVNEYYTKIFDYGKQGCLHYMVSHLWRFVLKNIIYQTLPHLATNRSFLRNVSYCTESLNIEKNSSTSPCRRFGTIDFDKTGLLHFKLLIIFWLVF
jgi:hypothetical protein